MAELLNIVGPCAVEDKAQMQAVTDWALTQGSLGGIRWHFHKPRTVPGFDGVGVEGLDFIPSNLHDSGLLIATEVLLPQHVTEIAAWIDTNPALAVPMILTIGSRNQNHIIQQEIAHRVKTEMPPTTRLMLKNAPWPDKKHWLGEIAHVTTRLPTERIMLCHRGFHPWPAQPNPQGLRNIPLWDFALQVREESGLPMLNDPSHEGGTVENVMAVFAQSLQFIFDGHLIETHPDPESAATDRNQALSLEQASTLLSRLEVA